MVEARSETALAALGDLAVPNPAFAPFIYRFPNEEPSKVLDMPLVIGQVTLFSCGGFSFGLRLCHCICDGLGARQFLCAWAATLKTEKLVTKPEPIWDRRFFRPGDPPMIKYPHLEFMRIDEGSSLTMSLWTAKARSEMLPDLPRILMLVKIPALPSMRWRLAFGGPG
ncbi:hypothetical protein SLA2020_038740 [Shorea laevis]